VTIYVVIEYNWNRVGGAFSTRKAAKKWMKHAHDIQPNLWWEIHEFTDDQGLTDEEIVSEYEDR